MGENFHKLVENKIFAENTFADCSLGCQRMPGPQFSWKKLLQIATNLQNFSPLKVSPYKVVGQICDDKLTDNWCYIMRYLLHLATKLRSYVIT